MKNIYKLISVSLISILVSFSSVHASSGTFKLSHDLGFGKDTNLDAIADENDTIIDIKETDISL